ncbi:unnamed protein product [Vicia faba]|uniref:BHLH domain-containing protein n=1 Tax=Vicia faba TaxID=3906 RepID=A0AAV1B6Q0_VICFA|nr:unnamed protein product [Vicia faba]
MDHMRNDQPCTSTTKVERRLVEKNRRNQMKILYTKLNSLLPNYNPKELVLALPDQVEEAINYIKSLEANVKMAEEKKERLLMEKKKRSRECFLDVKSVNSSSVGENSFLHVVHAEIPQCYVQFGATKVSERLKSFVNGSSSDVEIQPHDLWFLEIGNDVWSF